MGRNLQAQFGQEPQVVMLMPLLVGTDGKEKMSQSLGNYIGVDDEPNDMYGKTMSIPDQLIESWFTLCTDVPVSEIQEIESQISAGALNPRDAKRRLAKEIVTLYHSAKPQRPRMITSSTLSANGANLWTPGGSHSCRVGQGWGLTIPALLTSLGITKSNGEARRLMAGGGVSLDGQRMTDPTQGFSMEALAGKVLRAGKHTFRKLMSP
jgi:tyrosyl-tRNA synthetase